MATLTSVTKHFAKPKEGFITTLGSTISSGAVTVPLNSTSGLTNGDVFVGLIEPGQANQQCFTGTVDTSGNQITGVVWTTGNNVGHSAGVTIVDYVTSTTVGMISKGILLHANQDGSLISQAVRDALGLVASSANGWEVLGYAPNTVAALGNRSYTVTFNSVDLTGTTSVGQRLKLPRTVTAPTGSITLNGTSQYLSKATPTGISFTGDHSYQVKIKPTAYQNGFLCSRVTGGNTGFALLFNSSGQIQVQYGNGASLTQIMTYQSVPLNKWTNISVAVSVAAKTAVVLLDGVSVPTYLVAGTATTVVQPAAATTLSIGADNAGANFFKGQIAQFGLFTTAVASATLRGYEGQTLTGSESSLISAYKLDQASGLNDLNANANNLTATGSPSYSTTDTPFTNPVTGTSVTAGTTNYGIIMAQTFSTNTTYTIQIPEGETLPTTGGIGTVSYSTQKTPYGFPSDSGKWTVGWYSRTNLSQSSPTTSTWYNPGGVYFNLPLGQWKINSNVSLYSARGTATAFSVNFALGTGASTPIVESCAGYYFQTSSVTDQQWKVSSLINYTQTTASSIYLLIGTGFTGAFGGIALRGDLGANTPLVPFNDTVICDNAYL